MNVSLSGDFLMDVRLSLNFGVKVGLSGGVDLSGVVVGVDGGDVGEGSGLGVGGVGQGLVGVRVGEAIAVSGVVSHGGNDASTGGSDERENSDKSLHFEYELLLMLQ